MKDSVRTLAVASAVLLVIALVWFFVLYQPKRSRLQTLQTESQNVISLIKSFRSSSQEVAGLEKEIEELKQDLEGTRSKILAKEGLGTAIMRLKSEGKKYGLQFQNMIPDYAALAAAKTKGGPGAAVLKLPVHIKLRGRYNSFGRYLASLETLPFLVSFGDMSLAYDTEIFPDVAILFDAVLYMRNDTRNVM